MIAEFRLYHPSVRNPVAHPDQIRISVSDPVSLKAIDGVLEMLKVHRGRVAAGMPRFENLDDSTDDEDEREEL